MVYVLAPRVGQYNANKGLFSGGITSWWESEFDDWGGQNSGQKLLTWKCHWNHSWEIIEVIYGDLYYDVWWFMVTYIVMYDIKYYFPSKPSQRMWPVLKKAIEKAVTVSAPWNCPEATEQGLPFRLVQTHCLSVDSHTSQWFSEYWILLGSTCIAFHDPCLMAPNGPAHPLGQETVLTTFPIVPHEFSHPQPSHPFPSACMRGVERPWKAGWSKSSSRCTCCTKLW